jgi:hypothetical protein
MCSVCLVNWQNSPLLFSIEFRMMQRPPLPSPPTYPPTEMSSAKVLKLDK